MKQARKRENFIMIVLGLVIQLVQMGIFIPIVSLTSKSPKSREDKMAINGYFRIAGVDNLVWMHVQHGYGVIINEFIEVNGEKINLVEQLSKYYWYIDYANNTIRCAELSGKSLWRCIGSLMLYGDIQQNMPRWMEVHHKWWKWCNTQETLRFVCKEKHRYFHDHVNSRKSHRKGMGAYTLEEIVRCIGNIVVENQRWKHIDM